MSRGRDRLEVMVLEAQGLLAVEGANGLGSHQDNVVTVVCERPSSGSLVHDLFNNT